MSEENSKVQSIKEEIAVEAKRLREQAPLPEFSMPVMYTDLINLSGSTFVEELYQKLLKRAPEEKEKKRYLNGIDTGKMSKEYVLQSIALSDEAISKGVEVNVIRAKEVYGNLLVKFDGEMFVEKAYLWLLGRKPEPEAYTVNLDKLKCGVSKADILRTIAGSIECNNRGVSLVGLDNASRGEQITTFIAKAISKLRRTAAKAWHLLKK